jgi:hypothetical protein
MISLKCFNTEAVVLYHLLCMFTVTNHYLYLHGMEKVMRNVCENALKNSLNSPCISFLTARRNIVP